MDVSKTETVDVDGKPLIYIKSPKFTQALVIHKQRNGFALFDICWEKSGQIPKELSGGYTKTTEAEKAIVQYIHNAKKSRAKRTNDNTARREQLKKSK